jgi:hypothetical protein
MHRPQTTFNHIGDHGRNNIRIASWRVFNGSIVLEIHNNSATTDTNAAQQQHQQQPVKHFPFLTVTSCLSYHCTMDQPTIYSPEQEEYLHSIEQEASDVFPKSKVFGSVQELREELRRFAVSTVGTKLCCTKCTEPQYLKNGRDKVKCVLYCACGKAKDLPIVHSLRLSIPNSFL